MTPTEAPVTGQTSDPGRSVPTRRIAFEQVLADMPKHFAADGDIVASHLIAGLSGLFPDGEDFFVRSVRHYRDRIEDPALKRQVAGFIGQEATHGREHRALNERLAELGYPTRAVEAFTRRGLAFREKVAPPTSNLAATAALEHLTATLAELILTDEETRSFLGHPGVRDLFLWHALEESEHKAVAFDVYRAAGGSERMRILTMKMIRFGFVAGTAVQVALSILGDRDARRQPREVLRSWRRVRRTPLLSREMWARLKEYERPGFHPDDRDTTAIVAEWRERLFGDEGDLTHLLRTPAA